MDLQEESEAGGPPGGAPGGPAVGQVDLRHSVQTADFREHHPFKDLQAGLEVLGLGLFQVGLR